MSARPGRRYATVLLCVCPGLKVPPLPSGRGVFQWLVAGSISVVPLQSHTSAPTQWIQPSRLRMSRATQVVWPKQMVKALPRPIRTPTPNDPDSKHRKNSRSPLAHLARQLQLALRLLYQDLDHLAQLFLDRGDIALSART